MVPLTNQASTSGRTCTIRQTTNIPRRSGANAARPIVENTR